MPVKFSRDVLKGTTKNTAGDFNQQSRFTVEIDGVTQGGIHKVDGLDHEHEMVAYQDADDHFQRIRPAARRSAPWCWSATGRRAPSSTTGSRRSTRATSSARASASSTSPTTAASPRA